jgi:hypothetical protein
MNVVMPSLFHSWIGAYGSSHSAGERRRSFPIGGKPAGRTVPRKVPKFHFIAVSFSKLARDSLKSLPHAHNEYDDFQPPVLFQLRPQDDWWRRTIKQCIKLAPLPTYRLTPAFITNRPPICFRKGWKQI